MDLVQPHVTFEDTVSDFVYDDGGVDYDWDAASQLYPMDKAAKWLEAVTAEHRENKDAEGLQLPDVNLTLLNKDQRFAFNPVMKTMLDYKDNPEHCKLVSHCRWHGRF